MDDRRGNPSDPDEEAERVRKALGNLETWKSQSGGEFSGGVTMQYGSGKKYHVQIGNPELAQRIVSRPIEQSNPPPQITEQTEPIPPLPLAQPPTRRRGWFNWLIDLFKGDRP